MLKLDKVGHSSSLKLIAVSKDSEAGILSNKKHTGRTNMEELASQGGVMELDGSVQSCCQVRFQERPGTAIFHFYTWRQLLNRWNNPELIRSLASFGSPNLY